MNSPAILMENIHRSFGKKRVLAGVTGSVQPGRVVGLLGQNGEGKTTLFRVLLDILAADSGAISVLGHSPNGSGRIRSITGYIPERPTFHDYLTIGEVLRMRSRIFPSWNSTKAQAMATRLQLDLQTRIRNASKGMLAKTAWICATAHSPALLLLDEPTSGLDALVRDSVLTQLVSELSEEGKTILVANHRMEEMLAVLDEIWVLSNGVIREKHLVEDLREKSIRVTGRLKSERPADLAVFEEHRTGNLVRWAVLDPATIERIQGLSILEQMEVEPLPLEVTFRLLLANREANHVR